MAISLMMIPARRQWVPLAFISSVVSLDQFGARFWAGFLWVSQLPPSAGSTVRATNREAQTAMAMVRARSAKSCPSTSWRNRTGRNMATVVAVDANRAPCTWPAPRSAALPGVSPFSRNLTMFSLTTMAASSTMPTAKASPAREMTFRDLPVSCKTMKVVSRDTGMAVAISNIPRTFRRNHHNTPIASRMPISRLPVTRFTARWMNTDASKDCCTSRPSSISGPARNSSITRLTSVNAASTLAPFCRSIRMPMAGLPFCMTRSRRGPRSTLMSAMSPRRTGLPSRHSSTWLRSCSGS